VHTAASVGYDYDFETFKRNNIDATSNIIEFAKANGATKIIYLSSTSVYGRAERIIHENTDIVNFNHYGLTKYVGELIVSSQKQIESLCLRLPGVMGKGSHGVLLHSFAAKMLIDAPITIHSPEFQITNFIHVNDLAEFISLMLERDFISDTLVLSCHKGMKMIDIVDRMKLKLNSKSKIIISESQNKPFTINSSKAKAVGWVSMSPIEIIDDYCATLMTENRRS
jgi:nucleoside-diphosphate-sugar epimerase